MELPIATNGWAQLGLYLQCCFALGLFGALFWASFKDNRWTHFTTGIVLLGALFYSGWLQQLQGSILQACRP